MNEDKKLKYTVFSCYLGYVTQAIVINLAPLLFVIFQNSFSVSFEQLGRLVLINFVIQIIVDISSVKISDLLGYRITIILAHFTCALGLILLGVLPSAMENAFAGIVISTVIYAVGGGLIEVLISPVVDAVNDTSKASAMVLVHSFYCWGSVITVVLTTFLIKVLGDFNWHYVPLIWSVLPLINLINFCIVPIKKPVSAEKRMSVKQLLNSKSFILFLVLMVCAGASELTVSQWASLFAQKGLHISKTVGDLLGPCMFAVFMGMGRIIYGFWGKKINLRKVIIFCSALCIASYLMITLSPNAFISLIGCAVCGFSVSVMWPGVYSLSAVKFPLGSTTMFSMLALFGDLGCSTGPWLAGLISDFSQKSQLIIKLSNSFGYDLQQLSLKAGILICIVFPITMLICVSLLKGNIFKGEKL
ncbi:MAG: MFS transporter [Clostridiales bacterium]|nr:MFS transporter [Clostridiales bacterium]